MHLPFTLWFMKPVSSTPACLLGLNLTGRDKGQLHCGLYSRALCCRIQRMKIQGAQHVAKARQRLDRTSGPSSHPRTFLTRMLRSLHGGTMASGLNMPGAGGSLCSAAPCPTSALERCIFSTIRHSSLRRLSTGANHLAGIRPRLVFSALAVARAGCKGALPALNGGLTWSPDRHASVPMWWRSLSLVPSKIGSTNAPGYWRYLG
jgi:hypothetical protein